jgi:hypothetical protein
MQLHYFEEEISRAEDDPKKINQYLKDGFDEELKVIEQWRNFRQYRQICNRFFSAELRYALFRETENANNLLAEMNTILLKDKTKAISLKARLVRNYAISYGFKIVDDKNKEYSSTKENVELMIENPLFRKANSLGYLSALYNISIFETLEKNENETLKYIELYENFTPQYHEEEVIRELDLSTIYLLYNLSFKEKKKTINLGQLTEKFMQFEQYINISEYCELVYLFVHNYFCSKDFIATLKWIDKYNKKTTKEISSEIDVGIKTFELIANYELGNDNFVNYNADKTSKMILKKGISFKTETTLILFLKKMVNLPESNSKKVHYKKLRLEIQQTNKDGGACAYGLFNLLEWVDEKIMSA